MNYKQIHDSIIERAKQRKIEGYVEKHHIIPKCMGGSDEPDNLVELTAREHFIVHKLLCRIYPNENGLAYALWNMCNVKNGYQSRIYKISSREYERLRNKFSELISDRMAGDSNPRGFLNKTHTVKQKNKWSIDRSGVNNPMHGVTGSAHPMYGKHHTKEAKQKMSNKHKIWHENNKNPMEFYKNRKAVSDGLKKWYANNKNPRSISVKHLETNKIFESMKQAADFFNIDPKTVAYQCYRSKNPKFKLVD